MSRILGRIREYVLEVLNVNLNPDEWRKDSAKTNPTAGAFLYRNSFIHASDLIQYLKYEYVDLTLNEPRSCSDAKRTCYAADGSGSNSSGHQTMKKRNTEEKRRVSLLAHIAKAKLQNREPTLSCSALCIAARSCPFDEVIVPLLEELTRERDRKLELLTTEMNSLNTRNESDLSLLSVPVNSMPLTEYAVKCAFEPFSHLPFNLYFSRADVVAEANEEWIKQALDFFLERLYAHPLNTVSINVGGSVDSGTSPLGVLLRCHSPSIALHFIAKCSELCEDSTSKRKCNNADVGKTQQPQLHQQRPSTGGRYVHTRFAVGGENKCAPLCLHAWNADATDCNGNALASFLLAPSHLVQLLQNPRNSREGSKKDEEDLAVALVDKLIAIGCDLNVIAVMKAACSSDLFTWEGSTRRQWVVSLVIITHLVRRGARLCCEEPTRRRGACQHTRTYYSVYSPLAKIMVQCINGERKENRTQHATTLEHTESAPDTSQRAKNKEDLGEEEIILKSSAERNGWSQDAGLRGLMEAVAKKCSSAASIVEDPTAQHAVAPPCFCPEFITRTFQLSNVLGEFFIARLFAHGFSGYFASLSIGKGGLVEAAMRTNLSPLAHLALRLFALPENEEVASAWLSAVLDQSGADPCALYDEVVNSQGTSSSGDTNAHLSVAHVPRLLEALKPHMVKGNCLPRYG